MIVRTRTNGSVLELQDETAKTLIKAGIYEEADADEKKAFRKAVGTSETAVAPLTTGDLPSKKGRKAK